MKIIITGSYGFIGSQILSDLIDDGHEIICVGRNQELARNLFPNINFIKADFSQSISREDWLHYLENVDDVDVIINCVGILQGKDQVIWNVHYYSPRSLVETCLDKGLKKIIQISALGIEKAAIPFAESKKALDDYLKTLSIDSIVIRPSLVYGSGSFGGTSLFRGLAALPGFILVPGGGKELFQPILIQELSQAVKVLVNKKSKPCYRILTAVGSKQISLYEIISSIRHWLGFGKAIKVLIPLWIVTIVVKLGDIFQTTINSTLYKMLLQNNIATEEDTRYFQQTIGFVPSDFKTGINKTPSHVQDRWHARLYFLRPLLRLSLGFVWLFTAITSVFLFPQKISIGLLNQVGITQHAMLFLYGSSILDGLLGIATLLNYKIKLVATLQIILMLIYSIIISLFLPMLWLEPFGAISKNIPILIATLIMIALESKR